MSLCTRISVLLLAGGALLAPITANAGAMPNDDIFCKAIGLSRDAQFDCIDQLANTISDDDRAGVQASWVSRSALGERAWGGSLYQPIIDTNSMNGTPGTPYQDKPRFIPNTVARDIERAVRTVMMNPDDAYQTGAIQ